MKSSLPKVMHTCCGLPMVEYAVRALENAGVARPIVVIGHGAEFVRKHLGDRCDYVVQEEQLGTGHAALMAKDLLKDYKGPVVITAGDTPLVTSDVIKRLFKHFHEYRASAVVASFKLDDPTGYGRIVRDKHGGLLRIVEQKDAYDEVLTIDEVNSGMYCFDCTTLFDILPTLSADNNAKEIYLTDSLSHIVRHHGRAEVEQFADGEAFLGVNDRWQLAEVERTMQMRLLKNLAMEGVSIRDPHTTYVGPDVTVGPETILEPGTTLAGKVTIGSHCKIGPHTLIEDSELGDDVNVYLSRIQEAKLSKGVRVGPFANIRPGTHLGEEVKIGNFVEIKKSALDEHVAVSHLSYIGDATVGKNTNIGAGTITCNYDGIRKHPTTIGKNVFVGSNSTLVAPVTLGDGSMTAAGSTITRDVSPDALGIGRARQEEKQQWVSRWREQQK